MTAFRALIFPKWCIQLPDQHLRGEASWASLKRSTPAPLPLDPMQRPPTSRLSLLQVLRLKTLESPHIPSPRLIVRTNEHPSPTAAKPPPLTWTATVTGTGGRKNGGLWGDGGGWKEAERGDKGKGGEEMEHA